MAERILAVDDDPGMRRMLSRTLGSKYPVELASSAADAREHIEKSRFAVALVDVQLGDGDGYALCREILGRSPATDVILISGSVSQPDEKLYRSLEGGAFYFLFKPFEKRVLRALVERCLELQRARRAEERYARELREDLERARRFQASLIPKEPLRREGWHLEGRFTPCDALGGDFYFALPAPDGAVLFSISDVVGHGVRAAMYAGMLRSLLDTARRRDPAPDSVLAELLDGLELFGSDTYASLLYGSLGVDGTVRYFNAGHPPPFLLRASGALERLETTALILTPLLDLSAAEVREARMEPGDRLLAFSDGLYEVLDPQDREWGLEGLTEALQAACDLRPAKALDHMMCRWRDHAGGRPIGDDATLLLVERLAAG